ncbi:MAG: gamma-glutamyltransferase [Gammaproteobacteria bacterium]|nr:MAG: gamma-glutamyltransferase [Gammaproteobacteria bacterium]
MRTRLSLLTLVALCASTVSFARSPEQVVVAAHPLAAEAGLEILQRGGNAMDAAVAVQATLTFVEPHESGIGGGGFLLFRDRATGAMSFHDGRETAPAAATPERFMAAGRWPLPFPLAVVSGRAVGVPGLVPMLYAAHEAHGRLPWKDLFEPAITLAETGAPLPDRMQRQLKRDPTLRLFAGTRPLGHAARQDDPQLRNPELADVLRRIATEGPAALNTGVLANNLVAAAGRGGWLPGDLTVEDLASYRPQQREPVCGRYRRWTLCSAPPPSSGGIALLQMLGVLEHFDLPAMAPDSPATVHLIAEASRLAFADRQRHLGDPDFVAVPTAGLIDPDYLAERARLINVERAMGRPPPGIPGVTPQIEDPPPLEPDPEAGTTHVSIIDAEGNAVALTSSIEAPFGSRRAVNGYLLNSQLTDFDFAPFRDGQAVANAVAPGKRPRSSMAPTFVFDEDDELVLVIGSRGGSRIIGYVLKTLIGVLDWELPLAEAVALPNVLHRGQQLEIEAGTVLVDRVRELEALGHRVDVRVLESGLHGIERVAGGWRGAADPRMEGRAVP